MVRDLWKKLSMVVGVMLLVVAICCIAAGPYFSYSRPSWIKSGFRLPFSDLEELVVDQKGNIYCVSQFYSRVQKFDPEGNFVAGWFVDARGGSIDMHPTEEGTLLINAVRNNAVYEYDLDGRRLGVVEYDPDNPPDLWGRSADEREVIDGVDRYEISSAFTFPSIVKIASDGTRMTVVRQPFWLWLWQWPFPSFLGALVGPLLIRLGMSREMAIHWRLVSQKTLREDAARKSEHGVLPPGRTN